MEGLDWKTRRRLERSRRPSEARPQQSPEERAGARGEARNAGGPQALGLPDEAPHQGARPAPEPRRRASSPPARKTRQGRVVSSKPDKTITVRDRGRPPPSAVREDRAPLPDAARP